MMFDGVMLTKWEDRDNWSPGVEQSRLSAVECTGVDGHMGSCSVFGMVVELLVDPGWELVVKAVKDALMVELSEVVEMESDIMWNEVLEDESGR